MILQPINSYDIYTSFTLIFPSRASSVASSSKTQTLLEPFHHFLRVDITTSLPQFPPDTLLEEFESKPSIESSLFHQKSRIVRIASRIELEVCDVTCATLREKGRDFSLTDLVTA